MERDVLIVRATIAFLVVCLSVFAIAIFHRWNSAATFRPLHQDRHAVAFDSTGFQGNSIRLNPGAYTYAIPSEDDSWSLNKIGSILVPNGHTVTLFKNSTLVGQQIFLRTNTPDIQALLGPSSFRSIKGMVVNDGVISLKTKEDH
jgi:hypothetical protein